MQRRVPSHVIHIVLVAVLAALAAARGAAAETLAVPAGGDLQAALDRARPGDVVLLAAGARYTGNFVLGAKDGTTYITVRSALPDDRLPGRSARVTPALAWRFARIRSANGDPALRTAPGAHHWRLLAIDFEGGAGDAGDIIRLGDGSSAQHVLADVPHDLIVDRCYVHGDPGGTQKRGIALNSAATWILNSWIADIKAADQDSQAIAGWNGPGPFVIENNYLEAAGENFLLGGADPSIEGLVPGDVTFRLNSVRKPVAWRDGRWQVKNLLELKNARRVTIENNVFENCWQAAQPGYAILFTPRNQDGRAPWVTVEDVAFRSNVVRHVAAGINILGHDSPNASQVTSRITIAGNLLYDVDASHWGGTGAFLQIGDGPSGVVVEHNTVLQSGNIVTAYGGGAASQAQVRGFVFRDNLVLHNEYGIKGDNAGTGNATLSAYFPGAVVAGNVIGGGPESAYPGGNAFPRTGKFYAQFVAAKAGDYRLAPSSAYATAGRDGTPVGADAQALRAALSRSPDDEPREPAAVRHQAAAGRLRDESRRVPERVATVAEARVRDRLPRSGRSRVRPIRGRLKSLPNAPRESSEWCDVKRRRWWCLIGRGCCPTEGPRARSAAWPGRSR